MNFKSILDIGIEFEFVKTNRKSTRTIEALVRENLSQWSLVHDGSTETPAYAFQGIPVDADSKDATSILFLSKIKSDLIVCGGEIISPILDGGTNKYQDNIRSLCGFFKSEVCQEMFDRNRASIHVHINVGDSVSLEVLKNLIKLMLKYEPFFYKIGGFSKINRGINNHFVFCRPITHPPVYRYENRNYPVFSYQALLESESKDEFFTKYYNSIYCIRSDIKYVPQRYVGLNFYSIAVRNSIEFRYANMTLYPEYIMAYIKMCQYTVKAAFQQNIFVDKIRTINELSTYTLEDFNNFLNEIGLSEPYRRILLEIYSDSPEVNWENIPLYIYTHVDQHGFSPKDLNVKPIEDKILSVSPENYRDHSREMSLLNELVHDEKNKPTNLPELSFVVKNDSNRRNIGFSKEYSPPTTVQYTSSSTAQDDYLRPLRFNNTRVSRHLEILSTFYGAFGDEINLSRASSTQQKLNYLKRRIRENSHAFIFPVFSILSRHTFTYPRTGLIRRLRGERITFSLIGEDLLRVLYGGNREDYTLLREDTTQATYINLNSILMDFMQRYGLND